jgi:PPE-repeat protein
MSVLATTRQPTSRGASKTPAEATAVAAARRERTKTRRRRRADQRGYGDEFMDMNVEADPDWDSSTAASDQDAGPLGLAGTVSKTSAPAAGLATLAGDGFSGGPAVPMVPGTWGAGAP